MFGYVDNESRKALCLNSHKNLFKKKYIFLEFSKAPFLSIPENFDDFKKQHKKKFWYNLRRQERLYCEKYGQLNFDVLQDSESINLFLPQVQKLFQDKWEEGYTSLCWKNNECFSDYSKEFLRRCTTQNAFLSVLTDENNELLSYCYCMVEGGTVYLFQHTTIVNTDLKVYSLGKLIMWKLIVFLIESNKYDKLDFMYGESSYKYEWTKDYERVFYVYKHSVHGVFLYLLSLIRLTLLKNIAFKLFLKRILGIFSRKRQCLKN